MTFAMGGVPHAGPQQVSLKNGRLLFTTVWHALELSNPVLTQSGKIGIADWSTPWAHSYLSHGCYGHLDQLRVTSLATSHLSTLCIPSRWCHSLVYAALQEQPGVRRQHSRATFSKTDWASVDKGSRLTSSPMSDSGRHLHSSQEAMEPLGCCLLLLPFSITSLPYCCFLGLSAKENTHTQVLNLDSALRETQSKTVVRFILL